MSQDVILGSITRSWSRGSAKSTESNAQPAPLTDKEQERIEKLAKLEMLASRGDVAAQKKMVEINAALAVLQKKSDAKSKRILSTLQESGLVTVSQSQSGPRLVMAGAAPRPRHPRQRTRSPATVSDDQQVSEFLLNLKMRAMAGDPQAIATLQQYQQIIAPPEGAAPIPPGEIPTEPMPRQPQDYPPTETPMAGDDSGFNGKWAFIRGLGEEEIALAREGGACEKAALRRRFARTARTPEDRK